MNQFLFDSFVVSVWFERIGTTLDLTSKLLGLAVSTIRFHTSLLLERSPRPRDTLLSKSSLRSSSYGTSTNTADEGEKQLHNTTHLNLVFRQLLHPRVRNLSCLGQHQNWAESKGAKCPLQLSKHPVSSPGARFDTFEKKQHHNQRGSTTEESLITSMFVVFETAEIGINIGQNLQPPVLIQESWRYWRVKYLQLCSIELTLRSRYCSSKPLPVSTAWSQFSGNMILSSILCHL